MHRTDVRMLRGGRSVVGRMGQIVRMFRRVVFRRVGQIDASASPILVVMHRVAMKMRRGWRRRMLRPLLLLLLGRLR